MKPPVRGGATPTFRHAPLASRGGSHARRLAIGRAVVKQLQIAELDVQRLRIGRLEVAEQLVAPPNPT
jgi:hypothetical protein